MKSNVKSQPSPRENKESPRPIEIKTSLLLLLILLVSAKIIESASEWVRNKGVREFDKPQAPTLVTYIFSHTDPEYAENLGYFLRQGIRENDGCDYVIVIQVPDAQNTLPLDLSEDLDTIRLFSNVNVMKHTNECYDLGTIGWVYSILGTSMSKYSYFVWLNSSVRGPFLPSYLDGKYHWTRGFTEKLNEHVKLVGSTLSCGMSGDHPPTLHVQTYAVATDVIGLELLQSNDTIFKCYRTMEDVVFFSERGISETILNAGYGIDSLMSRYQGIDWQSGRHVVDAYGCNGDLNPLQPGFYDGTDVDPMEVMFVKVKDPFLKAGWPSATKAEKLSMWKIETRIENQTDQIILASANDWLTSKVEKLIQDAKKRTMSCFDWEFYLEANKQDPLIDDEEENKEAAAWEQFLDMGIYEGRPHKWRDDCIS